MIIPKLQSALAYGGDYNPEQWPEAVWAEDMHLMKEAGVNLVTLGVFSWAMLQPREDVFEFGWLDRIMDLLAAHEIRVDLATATASPPPWLSHRYPDVLAVDANGQTTYPGSRQHYSPSSSIYRRHASALVYRLAERYRSHPALAAWHINNEYGNHVAECHSAESTRAFQTWLRTRYGTLDALNDAWGTRFWSQVYSAWEEILTPRRTPTFANPAQQLDFKRFTNDALLKLYRMEKEILMEFTPGIPVTTNFMGFHKPTDYARWAPKMDFVSWDSYPDPLAGLAASHAAAAAHALTRSLKRDRPFLLMEQSVSSVTWRPVNAAKPPGLMRLWSWQAIAQGADGVLFFQWRASRAGAEKFLGGMVAHVQAAESRTFAEICRLGQEVKALARVSGSLIQARVALVFDWECWWAVEADSKPAPFAYAAWAQELHASLHRRNIAVDFVRPDEDLTRYALVIAPTLYLLSQENAGNLRRYATAGGTLVVSYFSGIVDTSERVHLGGYLAPLRDVLGLWVEDWYPMAHDSRGAGHWIAGGEELLCEHWQERVHLEGAEALAVFDGPGPLKGAPALTLHRCGQGRALYLATRPSGRSLDEVLVKVCAEAGVASPLSVPVGVEVTLREGASGEFLFLLNHNAETVSFSLEGRAGRNLVTGAETHGSLTLPGWECLALHLQAQ